jgi:hypothetical protein
MTTLGRKQVIISADSRVGDVIRVQTRNTAYTLTVTNPRENEVTIQGGRWVKPTPAYIYGGHLEEGRSMTVVGQDDENVVASSTIKSIAVTRVTRE